MEITLGSLGFSTFRQLIDLWDEQVDKQQKEKQIRNLVDGQGMLLFFKFHNEIFGCGEDGRIVFARIKNPDKDDKEWGKEASFSALNLSKTIEGENSSSIFGRKDLKQMKIIDQKEAITELCKKNFNTINQTYDNTTDHKPDNFIQAMEQ